MKKLALIISFLLCTQIHAQLKIGYVDSDTILKQLPDAVDAQKRLDALIAEWKEELVKMENELKTKRNAFEEKKLIKGMETILLVDDEKMILDVPPTCQPMLGDPSVDLWITEGTKKADAGASRGLCIIALLGVWNWRGRNDCLVGNS